MSHEDFVTYEQAIALKKLGFDLYSDYIFTPEEKTCPKYILSYDYQGREGYVDAPTLSQVQRWLRKEKDLYLIWDMGQDRKHNSKFAWYVCDCHGYIIDTLADDFKHNTPEEALSAGITECIKILEKECQN